MPKQGIKHLVKCACVLPQFSKLSNPPSHEFVVFSVLDDASNELEVTFVQCDNCGVIHKVVDVCTSTILRGRDEMSSLIRVEDVKTSVPAKISEVLEQHKVDLASWQQAAWIVENKEWGASVVLSSEYVDGVRQGKIVTILGESLYKISGFVSETVTR